MSPCLGVRKNSVVFFAYFIYIAFARAISMCLIRQLSDELILSNYHYQVIIHPVLSHNAICIDETIQCRNDFDF